MLDPDRSEGTPGRGHIHVDSRYAEAFAAGGRSQRIALLIADSMPLPLLGAVFHGKGIVGTFAAMFIVTMATGTRPISSGGTPRSGLESQQRAA
jgi:hypothetical protein